MEKLFERILNVIRKPEDESGFSTLIEDVGEKPEILTNNFTTTYVFCNSGFVISFFKKNSKRSTMAYFHLNTAMVKAGTINRYSNDLTAGIQFGDEHSDVENKKNSGTNQGRPHGPVCRLRPKSLHS
jgi:hypothetical protein